MGTCRIESFADFETLGVEELSRPAVVILSGRRNFL